MVKLVDMPDLGSGAARRVGSSPIIRTEKLLNLRSFFFWSMIKTAVCVKSHPVKITIQSFLN